MAFAWNGCQDIHPAGVCIWYYARAVRERCACLNYKWLRRSSLQRSASTYRGRVSTEGALRERLDVPPSRELDLAGLSGRPALKPKVGDALDALIYLLVLGESLPTAEAVSLLPASSLGGLSTRG